MNADQELRALLVRTIVEPEVLAPMEANGWRQGLPPVLSPTPPAGQPGSEGAPGQTAANGGPPATPAGEKPKTDAPTHDDLIASFEALRDPETGLIERKYATVQEAIKGRVHLNQMASKAFAQRDDALRKLAEATQPAVSAQSPAPSPQPVAVHQPSVAVQQAKARLAQVQARIKENEGILSDNLSEDFVSANTALAEALADDRVSAALEARSRATDAETESWNAVDRDMRAKYPESVRFADEVSLLVQSDPVLGAAVSALLAQGKRLEATELSWQTYERVARDSVAATQRKADENLEADLTERDTVRKELRDKALKDAGVVTGSAGGTGAHENQNAALGRRESIDSAASAMRREGNAPGSQAAAAWRRLVIPLDESIFGPQR